MWLDDGAAAARCEAAADALRTAGWTDAEPTTVVFVADSTARVALVVPARLGLWARFTGWLRRLFGGG